MADNLPPATPPQDVTAIILAAMRARIAHMTPQRVHLWCNEEYAAFFGRPVAAIVGRTAADIAGPAAAEASAEEVALVLSGQAVSRTGWIHFADGRSRYVERDHRPVPGPDGRPTGYLLIVRDLTEWRAREEELAARTRTLEAILGNIAEGVNIVGADGRLLLANAGFLRMYGFPDRLGRPGTELADIVRHRLAGGEVYAHEDARRPAADLVAARVAELLASGDATFEEPRPDGRTIEVRRRRLPDGGLLSAYTDITARKEAERALRRQRDALRRAERLAARASLLGGVAHEINNPLAIVMAQATLLAEGTRGANRERARRILAAVDRCRRIVETFTGLARRRRDRREPAHLADLLATAVDLVGYRLDDTQVALVLDLPDDLPPVVVDPDQIVHLLGNLIANAQHALRSVPEPRRLQVAARARDGRLVPRVADNGPGIAAELRERVFDPFFTTKAETEGSGIGLALCRGIVADHGGTIRVTETPGGGATVEVVLPLVHQSVGDGSATTV
jgi:two-component system NtrC family sensor kinase